MMRLLKEIIVLSSFHFELESLTKYFKTLRLQTSALTSKSIRCSLSIHPVRKKQVLLNIVSNSEN